MDKEREAEENPDEVQNSIPELKIFKKKIYKQKFEASWIQKFPWLENRNGKTVCKS